MKEEYFEKKLRESRDVYEKIEIPDRLSEIVERTLDEKRRENEMSKGKVIQMRKRRSPGKVAGIAAACAVFCFTAGLNISPAFAEDMGNIPVVGAISKVLTFRSYEVADGDKTISAEIPQVEGQENGYSQEVNDEILRIVADYEARANESIAEYKEAFLATGGTEEEFEAKNIQVKVDYEVKCETEDTLSLVLTAYEDWNSSSVVTEYYNINLTDDSELTLEDLLGPDYVEIVNQEIKSQIAADDSGLYFDEEMGGFTTITDETNFYVNEAGNPVIVFQKYEIAAGAAGMPEFEIVTE